MLLYHPDALQEALPMPLPWYEPPRHLAPTTSDVLETSRDQRTPSEVVAYLKGRYCPKSMQGKKICELRWVTYCLIPDPTENSTPRYADWEAYASLFVAIVILTRNDGIR
jgi:hypothetical protein